MTNDNDHQGNVNSLTYTAIIIQTHQEPTSESVLI